MTGQESMRGIRSPGCRVEMRERLAMYMWGPRRDEGSLGCGGGDGGCPAVGIRGSLELKVGGPGRGAALCRALPGLV